MTLEMVLDAASDMDLTVMGMKDVARQLGVGVATVYRYVRDRDELIRLASARAAHRAVPVQQSQTWQGLLHAYAGSIAAGMVDKPVLLQLYLEGQIGPELEIEFVDQFVDAMQHHGFSAVRTLEIYRALGYIAMGYAIAAVHARNHKLRSGPVAEAIDSAIAVRDQNELEGLKKCLADYKSAVVPDLTSAVDALIMGLAPDLLK